ncbi:MAG: hypothetical protein MHPSP_001660 [Paramarteilia canceri]
MSLICIFLVICTKELYGPDYSYFGTPYIYSNFKIALEQLMNQINLIKIGNLKSTSGIYQQLDKFMQDQPFGSFAVAGDDFIESICDNLEDMFIRPVKINNEEQTTFYEELNSLNEANINFKTMLEKVLDTATADKVCKYNRECQDDLNEHIKIMKESYSHLDYNLENLGFTWKTQSEYLKDQNLNKIDPEFCENLRNSMFNHELSLDTQADKISRILRPLVEENFAKFGDTLSTDKLQEIVANLIKHSYSIIETSQKVYLMIMFMSLLYFVPYVFSEGCIVDFLGFELSSTLGRFLQKFNMYVSQILNAPILITTLIIMMLLTNHYIYQVVYDLETIHHLFNSIDKVFNSEKIKEYGPDSINSQSADAKSKPPLKISESLAVEINNFEHDGANNGGEVKLNLQNQNQIDAAETLKQRIKIVLEKLPANFPAGEASFASNLQDIIQGINKIMEYISSNEEIRNEIIKLMPDLESKVANINYFADQVVENLLHAQDIVDKLKYIQDKLVNNPTQNILESPERSYRRYFQTSFENFNNNLSDMYISDVQKAMDALKDFREAILMVEIGWKFSIMLMMLAVLGSLFYTFAPICEECVSSKAWPREEMLLAKKIAVPMSGSII